MIKDYFGGTWWANEIIMVLKDRQVKHESEPERAARGGVGLTQLAKKAKETGRRSLEFWTIE